MSQRFGGSWTEQKMTMVVEYAKAYLTIMNRQRWVKTIYFDGFAGSGVISDEEDQPDKKGTCLRILEIEKPQNFDIYYFVELNAQYKELLENRIRDEYPGRGAHVVNADCNRKLIDLSEYLRKYRQFRALIFIDPYGMAVNWSSLELLKGLGVDLWILVPTGIGANRLLRKDGKISDGWYNRLQLFLGMSRSDIDENFYKVKKNMTLFGVESSVEKIKDSVQRLGELYAERLGTIFKHVSTPFVMRNGSNSIMYHFMMATNNEVGVKIANDVIKSKFEYNGTEFD